MRVLERMFVFLNAYLWAYAASISFFMLMGCTPTIEKQPEYRSSYYLMQMCKLCDDAEVE